MIDYAYRLLSEIPLHHLSILLLLGLALFGGTVGGNLFRKLRIPQVVGYILVGVLIGQTGLKIVNKDIVNILQPFNYFALGLIGFMIGSELKKETLLQYGKQFVYILIFEGVTAFVLVLALVVTVGGFFIEDVHQKWALGLLLGAIASATAPAATTDVLWEYKTRGPLTTTVLGIVALDDGLSLLLFAMASGISGSLTGGTNGGLLTTLLHLFHEIFGSLLIGCLAGLLLGKILKQSNDKDRILAFSTGTVLFVVGIALTFQLGALLAAMTLGVILTNYAPQRSENVFRLVGNFTPPIYILFFVLFGAKLDLGYMTPFMALLAVAYLVGRTAGKMVGAHVGARISGASTVIQKYLPACLFSQAGVAIGLSILAGQRFENEIGDTILVVITTTTFVVQIIGPPMTRWGVTRAGEVGRNLTEEDLIQESRVADIMDMNVPLIYGNMLLSDVLRIFSENPNLNYPVVTANRRLLGVITIDTIKDTFSMSDLDGLLLAYDLMEPVAATAHPEMPMAEVKQLLDRHDLDYLPVVENDALVGFLESRMIQKLVTEKLLRIQAGMVPAAQSVV